MLSFLTLINLSLSILVFPITSANFFYGFCKSPGAILPRKRPAMYDITGKAVQVLLLNIGIDLREEIYGRVEQIVNWNRARRDINEALCHFLANLLCSYRYGYAHGMLTVYFSRVITQEVATIAGTVHIIYVKSC